MSKFYPIHPNAEKAIEKLIGVSTSKHPTKDGFYFTQQIAPNTWRIGFASNDGRRKLLPEMEFSTGVPANTAARGLAAKGPLPMPPKRAKSRRGKAKNETDS